MSLFSRGLMTFVTRMVVLLVNIPTSIIIARTLGAGGQGTYTAALLFPSMFSFVALMGMDSAYTYFMSGRRYAIQQVLAQGTATILALTVITVPVYIVFAVSYGAAVKASFQIALLYAAVLVPIGLAKWVAVAFLVGFEDIRRFNLLTLLSAVILLFTVSMSLLVFHRGVKSTIAAFAISELFYVVATMVCIAKRMGLRSLRPAFNRELVRASLAYGLKGHLGAVLVQLVYRFDTFLIVYFLGVVQQGFYSIAVLLAEKLSHLPNSIQIVLFPRVSAMTKDQANLVTPRVVRTTLLIMVIGGIVLAASSEFLVLLFYGRRFVHALPAMRILIPGVVFLSIFKILSSDLSGRDRRIYSTIAACIAFGVNAFLNLVLIPRIGISGAAVASTVSYAIQSVIMVAFFVRVSGVSAVSVLLPAKDDIPHYARWVRETFRGLKTRLPAPES